MRKCKGSLHIRMAIKLHDLLIKISLLSMILVWDLSHNHDAVQWQSPAWATLIMMHHM